MRDAHKQTKAKKEMERHTNILDAYGVCMYVCMKNGSKQAKKPQAQTHKHTNRKKPKTASHDQRQVQHLFGFFFLSSFYSSPASLSLMSAYHDRSTSVLFVLCTHTHLLIHSKARGGTQGKNTSTKKITHTHNHTHTFR